jgi:hypothetical protein
MVMLDDPALLHAAVEMDYEDRWPDLEPPTFEDCIAFCSEAVADQQQTDETPV